MSDISKLIEQFDLHGNDKAFVSRIFAEGISTYQSRLKQYEFYDLDKVLDAACGFGQWSLALASINKNIHSCDISPDRISFLSALINSEKVKNIQPQISSIEKLPYENNSFDAVFCYGALFVTPWKKSLTELVRVLKTGGRLYVNANGLGWYKHLWYSNHNHTDDYSPRKVVAEVWMNTYKYQTGQHVPFPAQLIIEPEELMKAMEDLKIKNIKMDGEGLLNNPRNKKTFFKKNYYGDIGVYEIIGEKQ
tara:strand:- start:1198 stop:1944 length:747 start_codon:yes stop_codon:yes gene_type:complete